MTQHVRDGQISDATEHIMRRLLESAHADGFDDGYRAGIQRAAALIQQRAGKIGGSTGDQMWEASIAVMTVGDEDLAQRREQRRAA